MTTQELFRKIDANLAAIREHRPLSEAEVKQLDSYYRIGTTYSSNALDPNTTITGIAKVLTAFPDFCEPFS